MLNKKRIIIIVVAAFVVIGAAIGGYFLYQHSQKRGVELQYGDYSITKERYRELVSEAHEAVVSEEDARVKLIESLKSQAAAKKVGLKETEYKIVAASLAFQASGEVVTDIDAESYAQRINYPEAIKTELNYRSQGGYRVAKFEFPFTRRIYEADSFKVEYGEEENKARLGEGPTIEQIREDVAYSRKKAEEIHKRLIAGESYTKLLKEVQNDKRLVYGGASNTSGVDIIPFSDRLERGDGIIVVYGDSAEQLNEQTPGDVSPIEDIPGAPFRQDYPDELNIENGLVSTGFEFSYYIDKIEQQKDILQHYKEIKETL